MVLLLLVLGLLCPVDALCGVVSFIITPIAITSVLGMIQGWNGREVNWFACQER